MQPTEPVDLFLVFATDLVLLAAAHPLIVLGELDMCQWPLLPSPNSRVEWTWACLARSTENFLTIRAFIILVQ
jgi:hypothetical protein